MSTESPETELETLRREMELSSLGDNPYSISADKLKRLIELELQAGESPTTLPACPFCEWAKNHRRGWDNSRGAFVQCDNCLAMVFGPTQADADALWSRRSVGADTAATIEELHDLRQQIEDTIAVAETESDSDGFIKAYHFKTGAIHRLLAAARKGDGHITREPLPPGTIEALEGFRQEMETKVIPEIEAAMLERNDLAEEARHRILKSRKPNTPCLACSGGDHHRCIVAVLGNEQADQCGCFCQTRTNAASLSDAAEICAEMARAAATQAAKCRSQNVTSFGIIERYEGMTDALREAERRIRAANANQGD